MKPLPFIPQDDPRWLPARVGKLTASRVGEAIAMIKDGPKPKEGPQKWKPAASRITLLHELLAERAVGSAVAHYVTAAMQWGLDNEDAACDAYEAASGNILVRSGFYEHPTIEWFGASPDREIDHDGLAEVKCPTTPKFVAWRLAGIVPEEHRDQMLAQLACTRRKYCDFVAYDSRVPPAQQLFVRRFEPSLEQIQEVEDKAKDFLADLEAMVEEFLYGKKAA